MGGPDTLAAHKGKKVGGSRPPIPGPIAFATCGHQHHFTDGTCWKWCFSKLSLQNNSL